MTNDAKVCRRSSPNMLNTTLAVGEESDIVVTRLWSFVIH